VVNATVVPGSTGSLTHEAFGNITNQIGKLAIQPVAWAVGCYKVSVASDFGWINVAGLAKSCTHIDEAVPLGLVHGCCHENSFVGHPRAAIAVI
jgi:hypothetical protein